MATGNPESYTRQAHRAEIADDSVLDKRIQLLNKKFSDGQFLGPVDQKHKDELATNVQGYFDTFSRNYSSVELMEAICNDRSKNEKQKQNAMDDLDTIGKSVYESIRDNPEFIESIGKGSASEIDKKLPEQFKGIGKVVLTNVFDPEGSVFEILDGLDLERMGLNRVKDENVRKGQLAELVKEALTSLRALKRLDPQTAYEKDLANAYLARELANVKTDERPVDNQVQVVALLKDIKESLKKEEEPTKRIPENREGQLMMVRELLNEIELSGNQTKDYAVTQTAAYLEKIALRLIPEVAQEVRSRLKLVDCYVFMKMADGNIEAPRVPGTEIQTIGVAAARAKGQNHALDRDSVRFFLETTRSGNANGLPIARAWDMLQEANFNYGHFLSDVVRDLGLSEDKKQKFLSISKGAILDDDASLGVVDTNYYTDSEVNRRAAVRKYMINRLGGGVEAEKAVELAEKLTLATAETSIFNKAQTGNDQLAEDIYLKKYRMSRMKPGRNRGPTIHQKVIDGLGTSWLRYISGTPIDQMLKSGDVPFDKIPEGSYNYFFPVWVSAKIHPLRGLLTQDNPTPKDTLAPGFFSTAVDYFNKADPPELMVTKPDGKGSFMESETVAEEDGGTRKRDYIEYNGTKYEVITSTNEEGDEVKKVNFGQGEVELKLSKSGRKDLRTWWLLGVVQQALSVPDLGWDPIETLLKLEREVIYEKLSGEAGGFLSPEKWEWVVTQKTYWDGKKWLSARQGALDRAGNNRSIQFMESILSGESGGKKKR